MRAITLPSVSTLFPMVRRHSDERGDIVSIVDEPVMNVSIITCTARSIRSNHYHREDFHFMYVLDGEIDYFYRGVHSEETKYLKVRKGDNIFTPALELHATYFPRPTTLIVSSRLPRDQASYESDTVRVPFVDEENIRILLERFS